MSGIDKGDHEIMEILRKDGRATIRSISEALSIPESTARDRVRGLEDHTIIEGYRVVVDPRRLGLRIMGWLLVEVPRDDVHDFARFMESQPIILRGYQLSHRPNAFMLKVVAPSTHRLTTEVQNWRRKFQFKTEDLLLIDDVRMDEKEDVAEDEERAFGALSERLIT